ncbi:MAG: amidase family protein, partial [Rhodoplanes sp.]
MTETIADIVSAHRARRRTPEETIAQCFARIRAYGDPAVFIALRDEAEAAAEARALGAQGPADLPLHGVPVAIKDNIDVAGLPTTAACPAFSYSPAEDATAVARLRAAGAIVIGKTHVPPLCALPATESSTFGITRNPWNLDRTPGGSSGGSAAAVA